MRVLNLRDAEFYQLLSKKSGGKNATIQTTTVQHDVRLKRRRKRREKK